MLPSSELQVAKEMRRSVNIRVVQLRLSACQMTSLLVLPDISVDVPSPTSNFHLALADNVRFSQCIPHFPFGQFISASQSNSKMSYNAEPSSVSSAPAHHSMNPSYIDYGSMLKRTYLRHKESDAVAGYLDERQRRPFPATESATIINYHAGTDPEVTDHSSLQDDEMSEARPPWADAFQENVERTDDSVLIRLILVSKVSGGYRSLSYWIINYLGWRLELEPVFFYPLIDADGGFLPEDNKASRRSPKTEYSSHGRTLLCFMLRKKRAYASRFQIAPTN